MTLLRQIYKTVLLSSKAQRQVFWALILTLCLLSILYVYFLSASVMNVVVRKEIEYNIAKMEGEISELEPAYLQKKNAINLSLAYHLGFKEIEQKIYVTRQPLSDRLTLYEQ